MSRRLVATSLMAVTTYEGVWSRREQARKRLIPLELSGEGGGSWSTKIIEFSKVLNESKRPTGKIGQKALVQVQNRYSPPVASPRCVLADSWPAIRSAQADREGPHLVEFRPLVVVGENVTRPGDDDTHHVVSCGPAPRTSTKRHVRTFW